MDEEMNVVDSSVLAEEEVILWVTSDLCSSTTVNSTPVDGAVSTSIPITVFRSQENLIQETIETVQAEDAKDPFYITEENVNTSTEPKEKKSRRRGIVWHYFEPTVPDRARCNFCSTEISYKGKSTNNLLRHLRTKHADTNALNSEVIEQKIEGCVAEDGSTYYVLTAPTEQDFSPTHSHSSFNPDEDALISAKRRGGVWKYFYTDSNQRAKCKFCNTIISFKGGSTTNLLRHMKSKHKIIGSRYKTLKKEGSKLSSTPSATSIQHSFAEIVNECVKSDDENEFHSVSDNNSSVVNGKAGGKNITILSSVDSSFDQDMELHQLAEYSNGVEMVKERRKSALAWKYFAMENDERARCSVCSAVISFKGGSTGNLLRHLKTKHTEIDLTRPVKSELATEPPLEEQPAFETIENKELAKFVQLLNPKYKLQGASIPRLDKEVPKRLRKRGSAWGYFDMNADDESGVCQLCGVTVVLRKGSKAAFLRHLKAKHPETDTSLMSANESGEEASQVSVVSVRDIENIPVEPSPNVDTSPKEKVSRKMRKRGLVWNHFAPLEDERAKCIVCPAVISYKRGSTSNLLRHMKKKHPHIDVFDEDLSKVGETVAEASSEKEDDEDYVPEEDTRRVLRKRGRVWNYFKPTQPDKAKCSVCNVVVVYLKGSTTNLLRHMKKKHPSIDLLKEKPFNKRLTYPSEKSSSTTSSNNPKLKSALANIENSETKDETLDNTGTACATSSDKTNAIYRRSEIIFRKHFDKFLNRPVSVTLSKQVDELLTKMIVKHYFPFTIVESKDFRNFVQTVNPGYSLPSRKTISSRLIPELYEKCVEEVKERLSDIQYVTISTNSGILVMNEFYVSITVHFIDAECQLHSYLLDCFKYEEQHTPEDLSCMMKKILSDWYLVEKVNTVVSDDSANITAAINILSYSNLLCFANTMNLIVFAGLDEINELLDKAKVIVEFFKTNQIASKKLTTTLEEKNLKETKLKPYDSSKWTSVYNMFCKLIEVKNAIDEVLDAFAENMQSLDEYEWKLLEKTCSILKPLLDITNEVSEKNVTVSKVIPLSKCIANYLKKTLQDPSLAKELVVLVERMLQEVTLKFNDIEDEILLAEPTLLDPRFKNQAFSNDQSYTNAYHSILQQASAVLLSDEKSDETKSNVAAESAESADGSNIWEEFDSRVLQLSYIQNGEAAAAVEMENYLQEPIISRTADPLLWWRERKTIYPRLFDLMKRKLSIAATAASKEFTDSGQLVYEKRNKLSSNKVSMELFLNHNL